MSAYVPGGIGIEATGGPGNSFASGGTGITARGGNASSGNGGAGIEVWGGNGSTGYKGGTGIVTHRGTPKGPAGPTGAFAGYFDGDVYVTEALTAAAKYFKIDYPLHPAEKYLLHAAVESSEMMNIYTGNVTLDGNGAATVVLPGSRPKTQIFVMRSRLLARPHLVCISPRGEQQELPNRWRSARNESVLADYWSSPGRLCQG